jgi:hypothetical protein
MPIAALKGLFVLRATAQNNNLSEATAIVQN